MIFNATISRYIFAVPFLLFGAGHLTNANAMAGMVPSFIPGGVIWVYLTGLALIAAALSLILNKEVQKSMTLLGFMMLGFALLVHLPQLSGSDMAMPNLLKDTALAGAAFFIASKS